MTTMKLACDGCGVPVSVAADAVPWPVHCPNCVTSTAPANEPTVVTRPTPDRKTEPVFANPRLPTNTPAPGPGLAHEPDSPIKPLTRSFPLEPEHPPTEPMLSLGCGSLWHMPVLVGVSIYAAVATALAIWGWLRAM